MKEPRDSSTLRRISHHLAALAAVSLATSPSSKPRYQKPAVSARRRKLKGWQREQRRNKRGKSRK